MATKTRQVLLSLPVRRTSIKATNVLDVIEGVQTHFVNEPFTVTVKPHSRGERVITVSENEREITILLSRLTEMFSLAAVEPTTEGIEMAYLEWLDTRPVSDHAAATEGTVTASWTRHQTVITWQVSVVRPSKTIVNWVPTVHTSSATVRQTRNAALTRAQNLPMTPLPTGEVTVWVHLPNPSLSTAALARPDVLAEGQPLEDRYAVFSPGRPVAVTNRIAATRLTEESNEPHKMVSLANLNTIGWA